MSESRIESPHARTTSRTRATNRRICDKRP
jgi:hypothetical protein